MGFTRYTNGSTDETRRSLFEWMAERMPNGWPLMPDDFRAIYNLQVNDDGTQELLAVVALTSWTVHSAEMHIATDLTHRWATRSFIGEVYRWAFDLSSRTRLNALVAESNVAAVEMHKRLGHTYEGLLKHEYGVGNHALIFGMTFEDWAVSKWNRSATLARRELNKAAS